MKSKKAQELWSTLGRWIFLIIVLVILVVMAIIFRDKIKDLFSGFADIFRLT